MKKQNGGQEAYGSVEIVGGMEDFLTKDNAMEYGKLSQTQNPMFMFKMIHCNGNGYSLAMMLT